MLSSSNVIKKMLINMLNSSNVSKARRVVGRDLAQNLHLVIDIVIVRRHLIMTKIVDVVQVRRTSKI